MTSTGYSGSQVPVPFCLTHKPIFSKLFVKKAMSYHPAFKSIICGIGESIAKNSGGYRNRFEGISQFHILKQDLGSFCLACGPSKQTDPILDRIGELIGGTVQDTPPILLFSARKERYSV